MWPQSNDLNQMGSTDPSQNVTPPNYLSPQQKMQMGQYANSLMNNQGGTPVKSWGAGLGEMGRSAIGGMLMNQTYPIAGQTQGQLPANSIFNGLFGSGNTTQS